MKMIVGLGNPGEEYQGTRHNTGFMVLDSYLSGFKFEKKFNAFTLMKDNTIYVKPNTFMNSSGDAVKRIADYYHIDILDILVIQDDMDLEVGTYKLKRNSSSGGHNGIKSIISQFSSDAFLRLKVGISHSEDDTIDYVLGHFSKKELKALTDNFDLYHKIIDSFIAYGIDKTLMEYSKK